MDGGSIFHEYPDAKLPVTVRKRRRRESKRMKRAHPGSNKVRTLSDVLSGTGLRKRHEQRQEEAEMIFHKNTVRKTQRARSAAARRREQEARNRAFSP